MFTIIFSGRSCLLTVEIHSGFQANNREDTIVCPDKFCCRAVLLKLFMAGSKSGEADKMEHIAAILTNVTRLKPGRALLLEPGRGFIQALVAQLKSSNLLRRQGCAAAFRNCCFSAEVRKSLLPCGLTAAMLGDSACHQPHRNHSSCCRGVSLLPMHRKSCFVANCMPDAA